MALAPTTTTADLVYRRIGDNLTLPVLELMWGTSGSMLAALFMAEMTGEKLAVAIKHLNPKIPVILLTGYPHAAIERGALESGVDVFLTKPCLPEELETHVRRLMESKRR